ncbi:HNH endonuclease [Arthrobacter phage GantcherGoblin]|nr:HNH endonuclease [Arthrobacter phage GantcherGoblin]
MSEWRPIPGFPNYEMNEEADVRNTKTGYKLKRTIVWKTGRVSYALFINGKQSNKNVWELWKLTFPEKIID